MARTYEVVKKKVDYLVHMYDRRKKKRIFHTNMLKQWYVPTETGYLVDISVDSHEDDIPTWKENDGKSTQFQIADRLSNAEKAQLLDLLVEFKDIFQNKPGLTTMAEHRIYTRDAVPVRLPPYRIAHAYRSAVKEEIEQMLAEGIIEPSSSAYSSPIILVPKKDQALRLCMDYRKLNKCTQAGAYPMPRIDDLIDRLGNS